MGMQSGLERLMIPVRRWGERRMKQERPPHELERELAQVVEQSALGLLAVERIEAMAYDLGAFSYELAPELADVDSPSQEPAMGFPPGAVGGGARGRGVAALDRRDRSRNHAIHRAGQTRRVG